MPHALPLSPLTPIAPASESADWTVLDEGAATPWWSASSPKSWPARLVTLVVAGSSSLRRATGRHELLRREFGAAAAGVRIGRKSVLEAIAVRCGARAAALPARKARIAAGCASLSLKSGGVLAMCVAKGGTGRLFGMCNCEWRRAVGAF